MEYFVSFPNTATYHWQIELLIESFKHHGLQDQLTFASLPSDQPAYRDYTKNIRTHPKQFQHPDIQNPFFAIHAALANDILHFPFVLLHADMVLFQPYEDNFDTKIAYQPDEKDLIKLGDMKHMNVGGPIRFNDLPSDFFIFISESMKKLTDDCPAQFLEKAAYTTITDLLGVEFTASQMEMNLCHHKSKLPFIHYQNGYPPYFAKSYYLFSNPVTVSQDPFEDILAINNPTTPIEYMQELCRSYLAT